MRGKSVVDTFIEAMARALSDGEAGSMVALTKTINRFRGYLAEDFGDALSTHLVPDVLAGLNYECPEDYRTLKAVLSPLVTKRSAEVAQGSREATVYVDAFGSRMANLTSREGRANLLSFFRTYASEEAKRIARSRFPELFQEVVDLQAEDARFWARLLDAVRYEPLDYIALWRAETAITTLREPGREPRPAVLAALEGMVEQMRRDGVRDWTGFYVDRGSGRRKAAPGGYRPPAPHDVAPPPHGPSNAEIHEPMRSPLPLVHLPPGTVEALRRAGGLLPPGVGESGAEGGS
jgi:hypothetical protein